MSRMPIPVILILALFATVAVMAAESPPRIGCTTVATTPTAVTASPPALSAGTGNISVAVPEATVQSQKAANSTLVTVTGTKDASSRSASPAGIVPTCPILSAFDMSNLTRAKEVANNQTTPTAKGPTAVARNAVMENVISILVGNTGPAPREVARSGPQYN